MATSAHTWWLMQDIMQGWTNDDNYLGRFFLFACTVTTAIIGTFLLAKPQKRTDETFDHDTDVETSVENWKRQLTIVRRKQLMKLAGSYSLINLQLFTELFGAINDLQGDRGSLAQRLVHGRAVHKKTVGVATEVVECRNLCTLEKDVQDEQRNDLLPFVKSLDPLHGSEDNKLHAFMLKDDHPGTPAIVVRITEESLPRFQPVIEKHRFQPDFQPVIEHHRSKPVTVSFFVQSYSAAQKVQGYLLLLGNSRNLTARCQGDTLKTAEVDAFSDFSQLQETLRTRDVKADVEIHLDNLNTWHDVPSSAVETPLTLPGAWEILADVFQQLELLPQYQAGQFIMGQFNPSGPTVFGTLRIHHGYHAKMEQHGLNAEKPQNKKFNKTSMKSASPIELTAYVSGHKSI